ncbi:hypothetical protein [Phaeocystidibacter luteus]|uniref:Uncharacterized protein n=1 Tax=Phaeocystidibacter luteus TaxID=911197 RepID=A0A6N6RHV7_9FLAO|nr:hypothetical protein [Phaeocystidibacter luteus]KAB2813968.1 hypothetical protein F8C67_04605 [Phaeocystidibacter luteus]
MTSVRVRPRFRHQLAESEETIREKLLIGLESKPSIHIVKARQYLIVEYNDDVRHYWSPQLQLSFEENEEGTLVRGLYGPHPNVWAIFFYGYAAMGVLGMFFLIIGLSQYLVDQRSWAFLAFGGCAIVAVLLYVIAQFGQKVGAEQTFELHHMYVESLGHPEQVR